MSSNNNKKTKKKDKKTKKGKKKQIIKDKKKKNLNIQFEEVESDKSESLEDEEVNILSDKFDNIWTYQSDDEANDIKLLNKGIDKDKQQLLDTIKPIEFNITTKLDLTTHSIKQILEKIPEKIRPSIDDYLCIYYKTDNKNVLLNSTFVIDHNNYLEYGGRIFRKNRYSKETINNGINYICRTHREKESKRKNKAKLCYARIKKIKVFTNFKEEITLNLGGLPPRYSKTNIYYFTLKFFCKVN